VAGLSELFSQDLEDMITEKGQFQAGDANGHQPTPPPKHQSAKTPSPPPPRREPATNGQNHTANGRGHDSSRITGKQHKFIMDLLKEIDMTKSELNKHCVEAYGCVVDYLTRHDASSLIDWLRNR
jgi:hypothetical protein